MLRSQLVHILYAFKLAQCEAGLDTSASQSRRQVSKTVLLLPETKGFDPDEDYRREVAEKAGLGQETKAAIHDEEN